MPHAVYRVTVAHPAEAVFAFVADAENNPRWHAHVNETRWVDPPPIRVGRRARQTGHLFGRDWAFLAEVVELDEPRRVVYRVIEGMRVQTAIDVEPIDERTSWLTLAVTTPPHLPGPIDRFLGRLLRRSTEARGRGDLARLNAALETGSRQP